MYQASQRARETAQNSLLGFGLGILLCVLMAVGTVWWLQRSILQPIQAVTEAATLIGQGQLHLAVPVFGSDELGRLAQEFNNMAEKLRGYQQTNLDRLLRARQTSQATINSFSDPVLVIDLQGRIELANPAASRVLGVTPPSEQNVGLIWQPPDSLRQAVSNALALQPYMAESFDQTVTFRSDGNDHAYLPQIQPIQSTNGEILGASIVLHDVTRFLLLDRLKSDWVATVSHELKSPLTSVRLAVHVLLEEVIGPLEPKQAELLVEARESTERLLKLIEHLLALARLEEHREPLQIESTEPIQLLQMAVDAASSRAEDLHLELLVAESPPLPAIAVDPQRMNQVLSNLLDNALTYTLPGGKVTLSATGVGDQVCLSVADTGIGIPAEDLPHVFDRFFRVSGREQPPGTGLGLAIVREMITAQGGTIECESEVGVGSIFHLTLPVWKEKR